MIDPRSLEFFALPHAPWVRNAKINLSENFALSVSYNEYPGLFSVGSYGHFEVAIMVQDPHHFPEMMDLVAFKGNRSLNVFPGCNWEDLERIAGMADGLTYCGAILVIPDPGDVSEYMVDAHFGVRFLCADGYDREEKTKYAKRIFGKKFAFMPKEDIQEHKISFRGGGEK